MLVDQPPEPAFTRHDLGVTAFWQEATAEQRDAQLAWQRELAARGDVHLDDEVFVSRRAIVYADRLRLGARCYLAAHTTLWGDVEFGPDCTLNPYSEVRGTVRIGAGTRIGAHTSILGFNHGMSPDRPVHRQPLTFEGITIGDDVWIGSHVVVLDGVRVGSHSVLGAGAVVTRDVPPWSVVAGNPARRIRDRRTAGGIDVGDRLERFGRTVRVELSTVIATGWDAAAGSFVDHPGAMPTVRAWCDAVELADLAGGPAALPVDPDLIGTTLRDRQDPDTGLIPEWDSDDARLSSDGHAAPNYHVLSAGYALDLLGAHWRYPIVAVARLSPGELRDALDRLPWRTRGWRAGSWVDTVGTALHWNRRDVDQPAPPAGRQSTGCQAAQLETLFGWLLTRCDPATGLWGGPDAGSGWLEPVNGFYRLTRGTFALYGLPLPYPERTVDSVLAHAADTCYFTATRGTACNVLDVVHPLWLAFRHTGHRRPEAESWARRQLDRVLPAWQTGRGCSFALTGGTGWQAAPGLLGTEMWLAITWLLADLLGAADALGYRPRGIHRPDPAHHMEGLR